MPGLTLAEAEGTTAGASVVGAVIWMLILGAGLIKCMRILRRETTSSLCVVSLMLALTAFLLSSFGTLLKELLPAPLGTAAVVLAVLFGMLSALVGLTLGIVGLVGYSRGVELGQRRMKYEQGRKQAGWGIGLSVLFGVILLGGVVSAIAARASFGRPHSGVSSGVDGRAVCF